MNHVIAQGAPNSLIRRFQEQPQLGVELLEVAKRVLAHVENEDIIRIDNQCTLCHSFRMLLHDAIEKIEEVQ